MPLTRSQLAVVEAPIDRCVLVNAGPGTGKTHVLVERFLHLVTKCGLGIDEILMVTFTRKAAREMKERLARRLLEAGRLTSALALETAWVTNFHGLCFRLLRENALGAAFETGSSIIDQIESAELASQLRREFLSSPLVAEALVAEEAGDPVPAGVVDRLSRSFDHAVAALGRAQENLLDAKALEQMLQTQVTSLRGDTEARDECAAHDFFVRCLPELEAAYERAKTRDALVDFVDLQTRAVRFLENESGKAQRTRFRAILCDETQDTNFVQLRLLELLAAPAFGNVMAVGDVRQAIYSFRGARVDNIRELPAKVRAAGGQCLELDLFENFRSYQEVLAASVRALPEKDVGRPLVASALGSAGADPLAPRPPVRVIRAATKKEEAERIADQILRLKGTRVSAVGPAGTRESLELGWGHFAILMRGVGSAKAYEDALRDRQIPYRTFGGTGFFDRHEILDLLAYLRAIANPYDGLALVRILQNPPFGLSDRTLHGLANVQFQGSPSANLESDAHENMVVQGDRLKPFDALRRALDEPALARSLGIEDQALERLARLRRFLEENVSRRGAVPVSRLLIDILVETGYGKLLMADEAQGDLAALRRRKNVERLLRLARRHEERNVYGSLDELVGYLERAISDGVREEEEGVEADDRVVNVMTVHVAKGQERPVVFVAGLNDRSWPMRGFPVEVAFFEGAGALLRRTVIGQEEDGRVQYDETRLHARFAADTQSAREDEERRILFVAMTRAKNLLVLSGHSNKTAYLDRVAAGLEAAGAPQEPEGSGPPPARAQGEAPADSALLKARVGRALERLERATAEALSPHTTVQKGVHLSFSHVDVFDTCPLKYKFTFVVPLPGVSHAAGLRPATHAEAGEPAQMTASELGTVFHEALERWAKEDRPLLELAVDAARERGWSDLSPSDQRNAQRFAENFLASRLGKAKPAPANVEVPFTLVLDSGGLTVTVAGSIDRLDQEADGTWAVTDYKANRGVEPERYSLQLSIYKLAVERVLGRRASSCSAYFVRFPEAAGLASVPVLTAEETERRIMEVAQRIATRDFALRDHPGKETCWRCPFGGREGFCPERRFL